MSIEHSIIDNAASAGSEAPLESLQAARALQKMRRAHGVDRVKRLVEDVDGDWPQRWGEEVKDNEAQLQITDQDPSLL